LGAKSYLGDTVLVLALNEAGQQFFNFFQSLPETVSLHIDIKHLFAQDLFIFNQIGEFQKLKPNVAIIKILRA
jgi:hypothetical protein